MCNFNNQDEDTKALLHLLFTKSAATLGGVNFLLGLIEAIRAIKPNPITNSKCEVKSDQAIISWNKIIFKDKIMALEEVFLIYKDAQNFDFNLLDIINEKKKKRIINMIKTLAPVDFIVKSLREHNGGGFEFRIFDKVDFENNIATINPLFVSLFFCSTEFSKKALKYEI